MPGPLYLSPLLSRFVLVSLVILVISFLQNNRVRTDHTSALQSEARQQHQAALEDSKTVPTEQRGPEYYYGLYKLYYDGIPDRYDMNGNKITGIAPDHQKAIANLERAAEESGDPLMWMQLARIYENGMYNFDPQLERAADYYRGIMNAFPQDAIFGDAQDALNNTMDEIRKIATYKWLNLKYTPPKNVHHDTVKQRLQNANRQHGGPLAGIWAGMGIGRGQDPIALTAADLFRAHDDLADIGGQIGGGYRLGGGGGRGGGGGGGGPIGLDDIRRNDMHNTHNSQVVATVANSLKRLKDVTKRSIPDTEAAQQIRRYLQSLPGCDKQADALKSLDSIERNIIPVSSVDMREIEALGIIWNRIHDDGFKDKQSDLKEILYGQLADMQEHGQAVCATGRLERIVDTLNTFDSNVEIKPTYVINAEIMNKAGQLRDQFYADYGNTHGEAARKALEAGTAPDQHGLDTQLRTGIRETLHKDYVDTGILTENKFTEHVDTWINEI